MNLIRTVALLLLLVAIPVSGLTGLLVQAVGSQHAHEHAAAVEDPFAGWIDFRRAVGPETSHSPATSDVRSTGAHSHAEFERHPHRDDDATVLALDGKGPVALVEDGATSAPLSHALAPNSVAQAPGPSVTDVDWPETARSRPMRWTSEGPRRPPRA